MLASLEQADVCGPGPPEKTQEQKPRREDGQAKCGMMIKKGLTGYCHRLGRRHRHRLTLARVALACPQTPGHIEERAVMAERGEEAERGG